MPVNPEVIEKLVEETSKGVRIRVYVRPESNRVAMVLEEDELVFYTDEPPVQGRANASLIRFLSRALGVSVSRIDIVRGARDRLKIVEIRDVSKEEIVRRLAEAVEPW